MKNLTINIIYTENVLLIIICFKKKEKKRIFLNSCDTKCKTKEGPVNIAPV